MFMKIVVGILAVAIACGIAASGYKFGKYLAEQNKSSDAKESVTRVG